MIALFSRFARIVRDRGGLVSALQRAFREPRIVGRAALRVLSRDWQIAVASSHDVIRMHVTELARSDLVKRLERELKAAFEDLGASNVRGRRAVPGGMRPLHAEMLWLIVRARKPNVVVETGVCNGLSSAVILEAMSLNGLGRLVSIDLPEFTDPALNKFEIWEGKGGAAIPAGREVGWLVNPALRDRWRLELGPSKDLLPKVLEEEKPIDVFIHDSEHSYDNQLFEFRAGFEALASGGVLVATDITWSDAFEHFWSEVGPLRADRIFVDPSCALLIKKGSP